MHSVGRMIFCSPILLAFCTTASSRLCKSVYGGMQESAQSRSSVTEGSKASCGFWERGLRTKPYKPELQTRQLQEESGRQIIWQVSPQSPVVWLLHYEAVWVCAEASCSGGFLL
jgi:hypothetical protein